MREVKVLIVEDDEKIASALVRGLEAEGFRVAVAFDGHDGLWRAREGAYDLIVLDIMLPGRNGFQICADLRAEGIWTPILMLTAKDGDLDEAEALETGADDYLTKPFSFPVLVARVRALLRRSVGKDPAPVEVGDLRIDPRRRRVWRDGEEVVLTAREFEVLEFLVRRVGQVVSKHEILAGVWDLDFDGDPNIVEVYIGRLRRKLAVLVVLAGASAGIVVAQDRLLIENLDESVEQAVTSIEAAVVDGRIPAVLGGFGDDDAFVQVVDRRGVVIAATPNVAGLEALLEADATGRPGVVRTVHPRRIDDGAYRAISRRVDGPGGAVVIHVGATLDDVRESTGVLVTLLTVAVPVVVLLLAGLVWLLVGRTLRPVEAIRAEVAAIGGSELDRRVPEPDSDDEIARLAQTMNAMLDRPAATGRRPALPGAQ